METKKPEKKTRRGMSERSIQVAPYTRGRLEVCIIGLSPLLHNRLADKARRHLVLPPLKLNTKQRELHLKHDPVAEFRSSPHRLRDVNAPTLCAVPGAAFRQAIARAAIDLGGKKAEVGRLVFVEEFLVPVYGTPLLSAMIVKNAGMNRTPDVRFRALMQRWCARFTLSFVTPNLTPTTLVNLLSGAGEFIGVGDGRPEKGALTFGRFRITAPDDPEFQAVLREDRAVQVAALETCVAFDDDTTELLEWFDGAVAQRELAVANGAALELAEDDDGANGLDLGAD
jgi:hypothetical protein